MKAHTQQYKQQLVYLGKEIDGIITYNSNGSQITITGENLNNITPHYEGSILKSVMKQLDFTSTQEVPVGTIVNFQFAIKVGNSYEYVDYGNYIVKEVEKQEDTDTYLHKCYDKMLYAMKDYEELEIEYPITIRDYLSALCNRLEIDFANADDDFTNYNQVVKEDLFKDLGYTYRDILDQLAEATASTICINKDDKLEVRYLNDSINSTNEVEGTNLTITDGDDFHLLDYVLYGDTTQDSTPTPSTPVEVKTITGEVITQTSQKNLFSGYIKGRQINSTNGVETAHTERACSNFIPVKFIEGRNYRVMGLPSTITNWCGAYNSKKEFLGRTGAGASTYYRMSATSFTGGTPQGTGEIAYLRFSFYPSGTQTGTIDDLDTCNIMLSAETSSSASDYEKYNGQTFKTSISKNLLKPNFTTQTKGNITITLTNDGWLINGSDTANRNFDIFLDYLEPGLYGINGVQGASGTTYQLRRYNNGTSAGYITTSDTYFNITERSQVQFRLYVYAGTYENVLCPYQLERGSQCTSYFPYYEPIELCKIGDYKDSIKKSTGTNLFSSELELGGINNSTGEPEINNSALRSKYFIEVLPNTQYIISNNNSYACYTYEYDKDYNFLNAYTGSAYYTQCSFVSTANTKYIKIRSIASQTQNNLTTKYTLNKGTTILPYEPYGVGKWYIEKKIGKDIYTGASSEGWRTHTYGTNSFQRLTTNNAKGGSDITAISNYFKGCPFNDRTTSGDNVIYCDSNNATLIIRNTTFASLEAFKTWLSTHNTIVYYVLAIPTYEIIDNEYLIKDLNNLEKAVIYRDVANVSSTIPLKFSYTTDYETIDEEYIKNTRAEFSEMYGPVNSIVLSRSAESDNIYLQDEESIEENGLTELKIKDNQFMNDNDRDNYLPGILSRLNGLQFYPTDFESIGITYLDLCDKYRCKVRGNYYDTIMLNDEVEVSSGLNEIIYCDSLIQTQTNYKKADTTDRRINQAYIIVDKQNQEIESLTSKTNSLETKQTNDKNELLNKFGDYALQGDVDTLTTQVNTLQTDTFTKTEVKSILKGTFTDSSGQVVPELVKTTSATFDENGMLYEKTNAKTNTRINEVGMKVNNSTNNTELMFAGYDNDTNQTIVRTENMNVRKYFVVGSYSRLEDYKTGTGVFDI